VPVDAASNRRLHERLKASDLAWLRRARLKYGPDVRVLDLSAGGILLETDSQLTPDTAIVVELIGAASPILAPSRVLRCRVATLGEVLRYRGACAFKRPLQIPELDVRTTRLREASAARSAVQASAWQKVIARFRDGRMLSGYTNDFHPSKAQLHLSPDPYGRDITIVRLGQLKALFFVRAFEGNPTRVERTDFGAAPQGRKVEVTFHDNEVLVGTTLGYRRDGSGFFVHPADLESNNLRVFVTACGVKKFRFL